jgi:hypothetical protein
MSYKPPFDILLILDDWIAVVTNQASGAYLSAVLGLGIVGLVYLFLKRYTGNTWVGLGGALLAAVSGVEVSYSRLGFPHQLAGLALLTYCFCYLKRLETSQLSRKAQYLFGIGAGFLLTTHDQMLPILGILALFEAFVLLCRDRFSFKTLNRLCLFGLGLLTPLVFWQGVTVLLRELFAHTLGKRYVHYYFKEIFGHVTGHPITAAHILAQSDYGYFVKALWQTEGILFLGLLGIGGLYLLFRLYWQRDVQSLFLTTMVFLSFLLISAYPAKVLRLIVPFFPLFVITAGLGIQGVYQLVRQWNQKVAVSVAGLLVLLAIGSPLCYSLDFGRLTSGYAVASAELKPLLSTGNTVATPYNFPIYTFYLQRKVYGFKSWNELESLTQQEKVRYVLFDFERLDRTCTLFPAFCEGVDDRVTLLQTEDRLQPDYLKSYPNPYRASLLLLLNNHYSYPLAKELVQHKDLYQLDQIRLYRLPAKNAFGTGKVLR